MADGRCDLCGRQFAVGERFFRLLRVQKLSREITVEGRRDYCLAPCAGVEVVYWEESPGEQQTAAP